VLSGSGWGFTSLPPDDPRKTQRKFANMRALNGYAEQNGLACLSMGTFRRLRLVPRQYQTAEVHTPEGVIRVMLLPKGIIEAEWAARREAGWAKIPGRCRGIPVPDLQECGMRLTVIDVTLLWWSLAAAE
jgi:hypothetical protein